MNVYRSVRAVFVAFTLAVLAACGGTSSDSPEYAVEEFYVGLSKGDAKRAFKQVDIGRGGGAAQGIIAKEVESQIKAQGGLKSVKIISSTITGDIAMVTAKITYGNGNGGESRHRVERRRGTWMMVN